MPESCPVAHELVLVIDENGMVRIVGSGELIPEIAADLFRDLPGEQAPRLLAGTTMFCG